MTITALPPRRLTERFRRMGAEEWDALRTRFRDGAGEAGIAA